MRVWLLHVGELLPVDGPMRPYRYGYLARALQEAGHEVLRWAPTFCHIRKRYRFAADHRESIAENYAIQFVHSPGYRRNAGLQRLRTYRVLKRRFRELADRETPPDLILAAIPSIEWAESAVDYGRARGVPVVVDIRDLWPDVYLNALPSSVRRIGQYALTPYYRAARRACRQADGLAAVSQGYLDWALDLAQRSQQSQDVVVPLGFEASPAPAEVRAEKVAALRARGIDLERPICLFAGIFERSYDLETIVDAARRLTAIGRTDLQFVFCGDGMKFDAIRRRAADLPNVHLLGWVDAAMLQVVASLSSIGLCAYAGDARQGLPNKPFEYMAGRLAIVSSLPGELAEVLARHECGVTYAAGNAAVLADCLVQMIDDRERLNRMRANGYEAWQQNYRSRDIYARFVDHLTTFTAVPAAAA